MIQFRFVELHEILLCTYIIEYKFIRANPVSPYAIRMCISRSWDLWWGIIKNEIGFPMKLCWNDIKV